MKKTGKNKTETLTEIQSLHEQREEFSNSVVIEKGIWIEVLDFNPHTEQVNIKHRWEVEKVEKSREKDVEKYKITCKRLNIKDYEKNKKKIAQKVFKKHKDRLKASFAKCLIEGIEIRSIPDLKHILNKLGGKVKDGKQKNS